MVPSLKRWIADPRIQAVLIVLAGFLVALGLVLVPGVP